MAFERVKAILPYAQFAAVIVTIAVGAHKLLEIYTNPGPAIVIHAVNTQDNFAGINTRLFITFSKLRPCQPKSATMTLVDANGVVHPSNIEWQTPFPVRENIKATLVWTVPGDVPKGPVAEGFVEVAHGDCTDGSKDPEEPVRFTIAGFVVK